MADERLVELGLLPDTEAYKACYYRYLLNGLITQLVRIRPGHVLEEAHMRNRALIARYVLERAAASGAAELRALSLSSTTMKLFAPSSPNYWPRYSVSRAREISLQVAP